MIRELRILPNQMWQSFALLMIITTTACQQVKPQLKEVSSQQSYRAKQDSTTIFYLTRFSYTPETWARMMKNPEDRRVAAR